MNTYTVWVTVKNRRTKIENVTSDGVMQEAFRFRWFMTEDLTRWEFPMDETTFEFSPGRHLIAMTNAQAQMAPVLVPNE